MSHVLIVEDDEDYGQMLVEVLRWGGHEPLLAPNLNTALGSLQMRIPDLILLNLKLPDGSGFDLLDQLARHERGHHVPTIIISGDPDLMERAERDARVSQIHQKPCDLPTLMGQILGLLGGGSELAKPAESARASNGYGNSVCRAGEKE